jgi:hypothetical protein
MIVHCISCYSHIQIFRGWYPFQFEGHHQSEQEGGGRGRREVPLEEEEGE